MTTWVQIPALCIIIIAELIFGTLAHAQSEAGSSDYVGFQLGTLLPSQVPGVTEILPTAQLSYGIPESFGWAEAAITDANAKGTSWCEVSAGIRSNVPMQSLYGILFIGLDFQIYQPPQGSPNFYPGGYVGGGFGTALTQALHIRTELKFNINPGIAMYFGFGLEYDL
jgi:hypothetical protein